MKQTRLNTSHPTIVFDDYIVDPSVIDELLQSNKKKERCVYNYKKRFNPTTLFIRDIASEFLSNNMFPHKKDFWFMDVIRYSLTNETKPVSSGLVWHCENDEYTDVVCVLLYLHIDEEIKDGNLRYKDKYNQKHIIPIKGGTTIIMDGNVKHKPQDPYGSGKRDLIIVSFRKN